MFLCPPTNSRFCRKSINHVNHPGFSAKTKRDVFLQMRSSKYQKIYKKNLTSYQLNLSTLTTWATWFMIFARRSFLCLTKSQVAKGEKNCCQTICQCFYCQTIWQCFWFLFSDLFWCISRTTSPSKYWISNISQL